jgi:hypothetical protein
LKLNLDQQTLAKLQQLTGSSKFDFLGFTVDLENADIADNVNEPGTTMKEWAITVLSTLLTHYSNASLVPLSGKLIKYRDLPGGCAYADAFNKTAILPIAEAFGETPKALTVAAAKLGGKPLSHGDCAVEFPALGGIPLIYIVWGKEEYPASASILYDQSASCYLPTEDLAVLGEIASSRIIQAKQRI